MALLLLARVDQTQKLNNKLEPKRVFDAAEATTHCLSGFLKGVVSCLPTHQPSVREQHQIGVG